jgi:predicted SnoaL-like aldol condensation-catalyzing enzyme
LKHDHERFNATSHGEIYAAMGLGTDDGDTVSRLTAGLVSDLNLVRVAKRELNGGRRSGPNRLDDGVCAAVHVDVHVTADKRLESGRRWLHTNHGCSLAENWLPAVSRFYNEVLFRFEQDTSQSSAHTPWDEVTMTTIRCFTSTHTRALMIAAGLFLLGGCTSQTEHAVTQHSKETVLAFYKLGLQDFKPQEAFARYMTPDFSEHASDSAGGSIQANIDFLSGLMKQSPPPTFEVVRTIAEGDMVFLHVRVTIGGGPPIALGEIFRVQDGRIAEHWDLVQPPRARPINPNSVF